VSATRRIRSSAAPSGQRGGIAIIVALSGAALLGFIGIALDVGRLYINKTELQTAADACALAASAQLTCDAPPGGNCPASYLQNAQAAGLFAAGRNRRDFQSAAVVLTADDVKFSTALAPNANYLSVANGANVNSKYVMCTATAAGILPWFMAALGAGAQTVTSAGVATRAPSASFCNGAPIGICNKPGGYAVGEWIASAFNSAGSNDDVTGNFRWIDYTPNAGGNSEIRDQLAGSAGVCGIRVGDNVSQPGTQQGAKSAWNTRFGIYPNGANAYTATTAPPDRTGYAYPNKAPGNPVIAVNTSAYNDYQTRQGANTGFIDNEYGVSGPEGNFSGNPSPAADHQQRGTSRRLVAAPLIDCGGPNSTPITGMACILMLNPMSNGASGTIYLEYRGLASAAGSPCGTGGFAGGPAAGGPQVPTLVQ